MDTSKYQVCVVGGSGYLGTHLVTKLLDLGGHVVVLDIDPPRVQHDKLQYVHGSMMDRRDIEKAFRGCQIVINLAAKAGLWTSRKQDFIEVNRDGTANLVDVAKTMKIECFLHTSTESVLKPKKHRGDDLLNENIATSLEDMVGPYRRGKYLADQIVQKAFEGGLPIMIAHPSMPLGPGDWNMTPPSRMLLGFMRGDFPAYLNSGVNVVDARDVVDGMLAMLERGTIGERYLLSGYNLYLKELLANIASVCDVDVPSRTLPYPLVLSISYLMEWYSDHVSKVAPKAPLAGVQIAKSPSFFSNEKARHVLGFRTRPLDETLRDAQQWFRRQGFL